MKCDLIIRRGHIVDGTGAPPFVADLAIHEGKIIDIGRINGRGAEELDARGQLVTPGFVDVHTHFDGQVTWDNRLEPSSGHGVSTVIMGNCGIGFAPCRPADRQSLIKVMEGVEDVPEAVMTEGLPWSWETFPQYLDFLEKRSFDIDVGAQVPHAALRVYVMGQRAMNHEPATTEDCRSLTGLVTEAVNSGALGVTSSRFLNHRDGAGNPAPHVTAGKKELLALAEGIRKAGKGVIQIVGTAVMAPEQEISELREIARASGQPLSFSLVERHDQPDEWRSYLSLLEGADREGLTLRGQVFPRPVGILFGLDLSFHPFCTRPSYQRIAAEPLAERVRIMRDPAFRAKLLGEKSAPHPNPMMTGYLNSVEKMYSLGDPPSYCPPARMALGARAARQGTSAEDLAYDELLSDDGHGILFLAGANYAHGNMEANGTLLRHPNTIPGLGDGGAHYGVICDASFPTFMLNYWARDAIASERIAVETIVEKLTRKPCEAMGLTDRGVLQRGYRANVNVIDFERLTLRRPVPKYDLPGGGRRITQRAEGYVAIVVNGVITSHDGEVTGQLPGRLIRAGARALN